MKSFEPLWSPDYKDTVSASTHKNGPSRPVFFSYFPADSSGQTGSLPEGCELFGAANRIAVSQPYPQARAFDDDVIHADRSAFIKKLRARFVQNHCACVVGCYGPVMAGLLTPCMLPTNAHRHIEQPQKPIAHSGFRKGCRFRSLRTRPKKKPAGCGLNTCALQAGGMSRGNRRLNGRPQNSPGM